MRLEKQTNSDQIKTMARCDNENKRELEWVQFSIYHTVPKSITVIDLYND